MTIFDTIYIGNHLIYFSIDISVKNDSIGKYEWWGNKGYDKQKDYIVIDEINELYLLQDNRKRKISCSKGIENRIKNYVAVREKDILKEWNL